MLSIFGSFSCTLTRKTKSLKSSGRTMFVLTVFSANSIFFWHWMVNIGLVNNLFQFFSKAAYRKNIVVFDKVTIPKQKAVF